MLTQVAGSRVYDYSHAVGRRDMGNPIGIAVGPDDLVYVVNRQQEQISGVPWNKTGVHAKIEMYTIGTEAGDEEDVGSFGGYGDGEGRLIWPAGVALDSHENVYVTDEWMNRVAVFDKGGDFQVFWGSAGSGAGEFNRLSGIAIDGDDNVHVVDSLNHRVQKLSSDGKYISSWGSLGAGPGEFNSPWGIALDVEGNVYVADHKNHRVQKFTSDGDYIAEFGSYGVGDGELNRPSDVAVAPDGDVYVCDWANNRVQVFGPDGEFAIGLIGDAQQLAKWQQQQVDSNADVIKARRRVYTLEPEWRLALPVAVEFDAGKSRVLIADTQRSRLQIYNKLNDYIEPQFNL